MTTPKSCPFVGRGGLKLAHALDTFGIDPASLTCADFGCNVGGFTHCLLARGASRVYAIDTGYSVLDYKLRIDPRVVVMERTNALHAPPPEIPIDLVVIDMGWTTQDRCLDAARPWLKPSGRIVSLIKPHYEARRFNLEQHLIDGVLDHDIAQQVLNLTIKDLENRGISIQGITKSPIEGGASKRNKRGNSEWLVALSL